MLWKTVQVRQAASKSVCRGHRPCQNSLGDFASFLFFSKISVHDLLAFTFFATSAKVGCNNCSCNPLPAGACNDRSTIEFDCESTCTQQWSRKKKNAPSGRRARSSRPNTPSARACCCRTPGTPSSSQVIRQLNDAHAMSADNPNLHSASSSLFIRIFPANIRHY